MTSLKSENPMVQVCAGFDCCSAIVKILHGCEFWGVDKLKSAANFCK